MYHIQEILRIKTLFYIRYSVKVNADQRLCDIVYVAPVSVKYDKVLLLHRLMWNKVIFYYITKGARRRPAKLVGRTLQSIDN